MLGVWPCDFFCIVCVGVIRTAVNSGHVFCSATMSCSTARMRGVLYARITYGSPSRGNQLLRKFTLFATHKQRALLHG